MGACRMPLPSPLQIGVASGCAERHGVKESRAKCDARFLGFSRIGSVRAVSLKRVGDGFWSGAESEGSFQMASARGNFAAASSTSTSPTREAAERQKEAAEMVQEFYAAINRREIASIGDLFADDCVYEDLVFPKPFVGRKVMVV